MKWIKIKENTKETGEVLAIGFQDEMCLGYLHRVRKIRWSCENNFENLTDIYAYIPVRDLGIEGIKCLEG